MKEQRWKGDYQTVPEEFASSLKEEQMGMAAVNLSFGNDLMSEPNAPLDMYQREELEKSWASQLDTIGMQPHAREYLEQEMNCKRSYRKFEMIAGQMIDYTDGIQFSGTP